MSDPQVTAKKSAAVQVSESVSPELASTTRCSPAPSAPLSARIPDFRDWPQFEVTDGDWFSCGLPFRIGQ